jgi:type II secretory pathway component PulJ
MAAHSVSFRISRSTEDLAHTTHALSQRLVRLEQRLAALELQLTQSLQRHEETDLHDDGNLENVERLLHDCRLLLGLEAESASPATIAVDEASAAATDEALAEGFADAPADGHPDVDALAA